ncbi:hypothetical protein E2562_018948 [Oryza meyeriana var. granulata]|uniref:Histone deacetylase n=1 Tax=Oryza meyeriana var. granulata TaxID=110450 RepID=A0A6G1DJA6_9ORYZ|nr:hypothetical protein E2562_018948 [Oryza meyeriana var. granulata]
MQYNFKRILVVDWDIHHGQKFSQMTMAKRNLLAMAKVILWADAVSLREVMQRSYTRDIGLRSEWTVLRRFSTGICQGPYLNLRPSLMVHQYRSKHGRVDHAIAIHQRFMNGGTKGTKSVMAVDQQNARILGGKAWWLVTAKGTH